MIRSILSRALRSVSVRCLPRLGSRTFSTSQVPAATTSSEKIYELRTYALQPARYGEFLKLSNEQLHMRTAKSKLIGYWTTELGGLNEVVHLWEYGRDILLNKAHTDESTVHNLLNSVDCHKMPLI